VPKSAAPAEIEVPGIPQPFLASAVPDTFDARDLEYRPRLQPLPAELDVRPSEKPRRHVMTQQGNSCTGHAVAAMINNVFDQQGKRLHASPYMLYALARRYDEFPGDEDEGSSLRGALKGWYYHGVLPEDSWPNLEAAQAPDVDDPAVSELAMKEPLGAFYRVNAFRLDDMQSAVNELHAVVASATVHDGWAKPKMVPRRRPGTGKTEKVAVIERLPQSRPLGGHAFTIVGYNEVGFLVQNSWGPTWGRGGFATLPYDDWLISAYDAWVARPGVYSIVFQRAHTRTVTTTTGGVGAGSGPDLKRLDRHVVNLGNNGRLSTTGRFSSTPAQIDRIFTRMQAYHEHWGRGLDGNDGAAAAPRRIVIYAHGGLNSESTGLSIAWRQLNWWLNNHVYPLTFAWQSGPSEVLVDQLNDLTERHQPAGGLGFDLVEQFDRLVEKIARTSARWMWDEMKENAAKASEPFEAGQARWPLPDDAALRQAMAQLPGASLVASRLAAYVDGSPGPVEVHLVGHSAGSIFLGAMLDVLKPVKIASLTFLAPAIRVDTFLGQVAPHLSEHVQRFASFGLSDQRELDDVCSFKGRSIYQKSLLYLVSRALERQSDGQQEVPLLGMERFVKTSGSGSKGPQGLDASVDRFVWAPSVRPIDGRSDCTTHGGFDDDTATMTSVMLRILGSTALSKAVKFQPHAQRLEAEPIEPGHEGGTSAGTVPALATADVAERGEAPTTEVAAAAPAPQVELPTQYSPNATVAALQRSAAAAPERDQ